MGYGKIMPGIGCLSRRLYIEYRNTGRANVEHPDPCILCQKRSDCVKTTVHFTF